MALEDLQADWKSLLGKDGFNIAVPQISAERDTNYLSEFAIDKGLKGSCRYLLSSRFEHCGVLDNSRGNITPVLHSAMCRVQDAAISAGMPSADMDTLVAPSPYRAFGAEVVRAKNGYLVMMSPVTLSFCFLYAILAVTSAQATGLMMQNLFVRDNDDKVVIDPLEWTYVSHRALSDAVNEYLRTGTIAAPLELIRASRFDLLPYHYIERVQSTYEQMLDFLLLHEFGHIALQHVRGAKTVRRAIPGTTVMYDAMTPLPRQEEMADDFALRCLVGSNTAAELLEFSDLLELKDTTIPELDKFWAGRSCIARYTSSLQLLKLFDLMEYHQTQLESGLRFTNICELSGTHPAGQHRMNRAMSSSREVLQLPEGSDFNIKNILDWQNWAGITATYPDKTRVLRAWEFIEGGRASHEPLSLSRAGLPAGYGDDDSASH